METMVCFVNHLIPSRATLPIGSTLSGSRDRTIRIWDARNAAAVGKEAGAHRWCDVRCFLSRCLAHYLQIH